MFVGLLEVDGKELCMQKSIKITEIIQTSIKEFFPFFRFAFFWLFFIITSIWGATNYCYLILSLS